MHNQTQGIDCFTVQEDIHLDQFTWTVTDQFIVKGSITLRAGFQAIEEIKYNLRQRHFIDDIDTEIIQIIHRNESAAFLLSDIHDGADIVIRHHHACFHIWLFDTLDRSRIGHF